MFRYKKSSFLFLILLIFIFVFSSCSKPNLNYNNYSDKFGDTKKYMLLISPETDKKLRDRKYEFVRVINLIVKKTNQTAEIIICKDIKQAKKIYKRINDDTYIKLQYRLHKNVLITGGAEASLLAMI